MRIKIKVININHGLETNKKDFNLWHRQGHKTTNVFEITNWFKQRIESELPPQPPEKLNEEEKNEFYTTNVTAEIKPKYGA